ncbi:cysteine--tRNA ligase [Pediococcus pentosaceus]|uniref:cysteine--tRNA ligase n=1 Tax=Pediococcus pentosaceus TaxID=1255 RepID=UPI0013279402|nr:cysteine--tRNA ligase [Pediococcus pentosaceus]KAF0395477.1 cysteine--tRNA ligase [Pediococcus pentosaceus]KAF0435776.1 cysteine--tRNA ligase [Pediococcus pentosaceus]KAF0443851.1 cysteine--tRNA ligase [Pediococcus pentosaceus]MBF7107357.1 cysteine--tRNA ligase [Pediococcus pentosaceus]MBF7121077.1 cysteine--tRNA ligase [Pediococcus pentosaceus]
MIKIYNTMSRTKETFKPLVDHKVSMYVCGPTVYNYIHIGNARSIIAFDTIRRYFEYRGFEVKFVSNFTDVDDKMINSAREQGITVPELADRYIEAFKEDVQAVNVEPATLNPRATENIDDIIAFIADLMDKGFAYAVDGDVYYRARKFSKYGALSHQNIDELEQGASQHVDDEETARKEDPIDFALWKAAKGDEIAWKAPWGTGRPGWHIECSVMSTKYLGDTFDIHGGGEDLQFPHHENEIAQSEAKTGKQFARYWMHNGFVTVGDDNEKMSKSLGNFVTVHDLVQKINPQVLRFLMSTTQYRRPIQYTQASLQDAKNNLEKLQNAFINLNYRLQGAQGAADATIAEQAAQLETDFITAMDDDFNAQNGITVVYEFARLINVYSEKTAVNAEQINQLLTSYAKMAAVFGIELKQIENDDAEIDELVKQRDQARADRDFKTSDRLRDQLKEMGVILEDTPQGTRWRKKDE